MIPWIQIYSNLPQHRKTSKLAEELKISGAVVDPNIIAVGLLVSLWTWAIQNAYDGDLSECSPRTIANACQWKKKPETLVTALVKTGWLDEDMRLHDWDDYSVMYQELQDDSKIKHRERQRRYRERKKTGVTVTSPCDDCDAVPNLTITKHNITTDSTTDVVKSVTNPPIPLSSTGFSPALQSALESWLRYKAEKHQSYKPEGLKALIGEIRNNAARYGEDAVIGLIGKCMSSNWQGIIWDRLKKAEAESGTWHYDPGSMEGSL